MIHFLSTLLLLSLTLWRPQLHYTRISLRGTALCAVAVCHLSARELLSGRSFRFVLFFLSFWVTVERAECYNHVFLI